MAAVIVLRPVEGVGLDPARLAALYRELGPVETDSLLTRAVGEMVLQVSALVAHYENSDFPAFSRGLRGLARMADHVGFTVLSRAAGAVAACTTTGDATALAATWERLLRLAVDALDGGTDLRGLSR